MSFFKEFKNFIERGSAIDMAVGIIVGSVMTGVVNSLVKDVIMPPIGLLIGGVDFSELFFVLGGGDGLGASYKSIAAAHAAGATTLNVGLFLNSLVSFAITMFAVFLFVKVANKLRGAKEAATRECQYCKTTINIAATKCPNCCSVVVPVKQPKMVKKSNDVISKLQSEIKKVIK